MSFNAQEKSIRKTRRKNRASANLWLISGHKVSIQALPSLGRAALEAGIQATVIMDGPKATILQGGLVVPQIMRPFMALRKEPTEPQLGHIMTMDRLMDTDDKASAMIQGRREGAITMDLLKGTEDQTHMGLMIQGLQ